MLVIYCTDISIGYRLSEALCYHDDNDPCGSSVPIDVHSNVSARRVLFMS